MSDRYTIQHPHHIICIVYPQADYELLVHSYLQYLPITRIPRFSIPSYARWFAARGASVVVNDVSAQAANAVVDEINRCSIFPLFPTGQVAESTVLVGGKAVAALGSVAEGDKVIAQAVKAFGTVHVLINNAGVLRGSLNDIDKITADPDV